MSRTPAGDEDYMNPPGCGSLVDQFIVADEDQQVAEEGEVEINKSKKSKKSTRLDESLTVKSKKKKKKKRSSKKGYDSSGAFDSSGVFDSSAGFGNLSNNVSIAASDSLWFGEGATGLDLLRSPAPQGEQDRLAAPEVVSHLPVPEAVSSLLEEVPVRKMPAVASRETAARHTNADDLEAFVQLLRASSSAVGDVRVSEGGELNFSDPRLDRDGIEDPEAKARKQSMMDDFAAFAEDDTAPSDTASIGSRQSLKPSPRHCRKLCQCQLVKCLPWQAAKLQLTMQMVTISKPLCSFSGRPRRQLVM